MKILITGGAGFIGKRITTLLKDYDVTSLSSKDCDLLDLNQVEHLFKEKYDVVINCAAKGVSNLDDEQVYWDNLTIFNNLKLYKEKYNTFINIGSGSELTPTHWYSKSKAKIWEEIQKEDNFYNVRVWGCFGKGEPEFRFFNKLFSSQKQNTNFTINKNIYFDFIWVDDLVRIIEQVMLNPPSFKEINAVYKEKYSLVDLAFLTKNHFKFQFNVELLPNYNPHDEIPTYGGVLNHNYKVEGLIKGLESYWNEY
jgi:nucleoside-diphosphate-sugar epimerase